MSKVQRGESTIVTPMGRQISAAEIRAKFKIPDDAEIALAGASSVTAIEEDSVILASWTETSVRKPRKAKGAA